jgi:hypothetical protein
MLYYKLLKKYPGIPEDWEVGMTVGRGDNLNGQLSPTNSKYTDLNIGSDLPDIFHDYWEVTHEAVESMDELEYRMYFLVMYNISPIQQGIQALHAAIEYANMFAKLPDYQQWSTRDKTVIILNGGTSTTMKNHYLKIPINSVAFHEPDLNGSMSAIAFILDERVWDKEKYPDLTNPEDFGSPRIVNLWQESIGGENNAFMRDFIKQFRLA